MGIWIGVSLMVLGAILIALEFSYLGAKEFNLKLYKAHIITVVIVYTSGIITCILTTELEGVAYVLYTILMLTCGVFVIAMQVKSYKNAVKLKASMDRLNEFLR